MYKSKFLALLSATLLTAMAGTLAHAQAGDPVRGRSLFGEQCTLCHTEDGTKGLGPDLIGVLGRKVGSTRLQIFAGHEGGELELGRGHSRPLSAKSVRDDTRHRNAVFHTGAVGARGHHRLHWHSDLRRPLKPMSNRSSTIGARTNRGGAIKLALPTFRSPTRRARPGTPPREVKRPAGTKPKAPDGFTVTLFAEGLEVPAAYPRRPQWRSFRCGNDRRPDQRA